MTAIVPMIGKRFDMLTVLERVASTEAGAARYRCRCDCGKLMIASGAKMRAGQTKHCGCRRPTRHVEDMTGKAFGDLVAVKRVKNAPDGSARWHCICACGNTRTAKGKHLRSGRVQSCGCRQRAVLQRRWQELRSVKKAPARLMMTKLGTEIVTLPGDQPGITRILRHTGGW